MPPAQWLNWFREDNTIYLYSLGFMTGSPSNPQAIAARVGSTWYTSNAVLGAWDDSLWFGWGTLPPDVEQVRIIASLAPLLMDDLPIYWPVDVPAPPPGMMAAAAARAKLSKERHKALQG